MVILTDDIINIIEDLEEKTNVDLENLKFKILNAMVNYEKNPEKLFSDNKIPLGKIKFKVNGMPLKEKVESVVYSKRNKTFEFKFKNNNDKIEKIKEVTVDLDLTMREIFELFNL